MSGFLSLMAMDWVMCRVKENGNEKVIKILTVLTANGVIQKIIFQRKFVVFEQLNYNSIPPILILSF